MCAGRSVIGEPHKKKKKKVGGTGRLVRGGGGGGERGVEGTGEREEGRSEANQDGMPKGHEGPQGQW